MTGADTHNQRPRSRSLWRAPDPAAVKKARASVEAEEKRTWRVAHITVKKYSKCEYELLATTNTGFKLACTYTWAAKEKGKEVEHTTKLAVNFNPNGGFDGVNDILEIMSDSSMAPFAGADLAVLPLRLYMKKKIDNLPKSIRELIRKEIEKKITAERALE
jgi:hypothetical protein